MWAKSEQSFCLFYTSIQDFFEENDDEVDGRSSSVSFRLSQANCSANFFFNRYYFIRAASFFSNSSHFIGSKYRKCLRYFLFSCSDLFFCIFDLVLISFLFSIGLTVILVCFHHFSFDLTKIEDLTAGTLNRWNSYLLGVSFKSKHSNYTFDLFYEVCNGAASFHNKKDHQEFQPTVLLRRE